VTGKRLLKRFLAVFLMALGFLVFLNAVQANATSVDGGQWIVDSKNAVHHHPAQEICFFR
jgi:hypothetical protein